MHINHAGIAGFAIAAIHQTGRFRNLLRSKLQARLLDKRHRERNAFLRQKKKKKGKKIHRILPRCSAGENSKGALIAADIFLRLSFVELRGVVMCFEN